MIFVFLVIVPQVRSDHQRTHISARQHASCLVCHHPSSVSSLPVEETQPMPSTSASLEKKFMAQVSCFWGFFCSALLSWPVFIPQTSLSRWFFQTLPVAGVQGVTELSTFPSAPLSQCCSQPKQGKDLLTLWSVFVTFVLYSAHHHLGLAFSPSNVMFSHS